MPVVALQGQLRSPHVSFAVDTVASWWWATLRMVFPHAVAAVVLPDGFRVVAACEAPGDAFRAISARGVELSRRLGSVRPVWRPMAEPRVAPSLAAARRWALEALRRPCARGLVDDPVGWRWSTARDQAGAVCDPWVDGSGWNGMVMGPRHGRGADAPQLRAVADRASDRSTPLSAIAAAAGEATRTSPEAIARPGATRNVFVWLGRAEGWAIPTLASLCGTASCTTRVVAAEPNPAWRAAAARCLWDPRICAGRWAPAGTRGADLIQRREP
ncbi:MAG: hypothetical protein AAF721_17710 [Myxococcota bacterium]